MRDDASTRPGHCCTGWIMPYCNLCCLDEHHFPTVIHVVNEICKVKDSVGDDDILFFLNFPTRPIDVWRKFLIKKFSKENGYEHVRQYHVDGRDAIGQAVIHFCPMKAGAVLHHVEMNEVPAPIGCVDFGKSFIYVELQFYENKGIDVQTCGILWAPDLYCIGKPWFSSANYCAVIQYMMAHLAISHYAGASVNDPSKINLMNGVQCLRKHLTGIIVLTDTRSKYFDRIHQWYMSGKVLTIG